MITRSAAVFISLLAIAIAYPAKSQERMKYSVLGIEYIGESDKPIIPIVISDSKAGAEWYRSAVLKRSELELTSVHVVSASLLEKLLADTELYQRTIQQEQGKNPKLSETVSVTVVTPHSKNTFLYDTKLAISLFDSFRKSCSDDESLRSDLSHFQSRLQH
jgi:hypothetical protein